MTAYHGGVAVPPLQILDGFAMNSTKSKSRCLVVDLGLLNDFELLILDIGLAFDHADDHLSDNVKGGLAVMVRSPDLTWHVH